MIASTPSDGDLRLYVVLAGEQFFTEPIPATDEVRLGDLMEGIRERRHDLTFGAQQWDARTGAWREF